MGFRINHPLGWGSIPHSHYVLPMLGLVPGQHLPDEFREAVVTGLDYDRRPCLVKLVLLPLDQSRRLHRRSQKPRRVHAECPNCGRLVCAGHTLQHKCKEAA